MLLLDNESILFFAKVLIPPPPYVNNEEINLSGGEDLVSMHLVTEC